MKKIIMMMILSGATLTFAGQEPCSRKSDDDLTRGLYNAAVTGNLKNVEGYLTAGADPNVRYGAIGGIGEIPLAVALASKKPGFENVVRALLKGGANPHCASGNGMTDILIHTIQMSPLEKMNEVLTLLLEAGASPDNGALVWAANYCLSSTIDLLINHGADVNQTYGSKDSALRNIAPCPRQLTLALAEKLIAKGAEVTDEVFSNHVSWFNVPVLKLLISHGADVTRAQALHRAASWAVNWHLPNEAALETGKLLLSVGADPNGLDDFKRPPLFELVNSSAHASPEFVSLLISGGADVNFIMTKEEG
jgi:ankyrin repeat protein